MAVTRSWTRFWLITCATVLVRSGLFVSERLDLMARRLYKRVRSFLSAHDKIARLRRILEIGKKNNWSARIAEIQKPRNGGDSYNLDILVLWHDS